VLQRYKQTLHYPNFCEVNEEIVINIKANPANRNNISMIVQPKVRFPHYQSSFKKILLRVFFKNWIDNVENADRRNNISMVIQQR